MLIDCEEDRTLRAVFERMLREGNRRMEVMIIHSSVPACGPTALLSRVYGSATIISVQSFAARSSAEVVTEPGTPSTSTS